MTLIPPDRGRLARMRPGRPRSKAVTTDLARRGHQVERWPDWIWLAGAVCGILADKKRGTFEAGADPRRAAYALGW